MLSGPDNSNKPTARLTAAELKAIRDSVKKIAHDAGIARVLVQDTQDAVRRFDDIVDRLDPAKRRGLDKLCMEVHLAASRERLRRMVGVLAEIGAAIDTETDEVQEELAELAIGAAATVDLGRTDSDPRNKTVLADLRGTTHGLYTAFESAECFVRDIPACRCALDDEIAELDPGTQGALAPFVAVLHEITDQATGLLEFLEWALERTGDAQEELAALAADRNNEFADPLLPNLRRPR